MVRANGANTNTEIRPLLSPHPPAQCTLPAAGGGLGCPLAWGPAQGTRDEDRAYARLLRPSPHRAARRFRSRDRDSGRPIERRPPATPGRARTPPPARQRTASSRTTRKDFWLG
jgi:hypothetical protein